jgi:very-short-patch-repair endonuclease
LYCAELRLVLEIDAGVHERPLRVVYDLDRAVDLEKAGVRHQLRIGAERVTEADLRALAAPLLRLAREGRGGRGVR